MFLTHYLKHISRVVLASFFYLNIYPYSLWAAGTLYEVSVTPNIEIGQQQQALFLPFMQSLNTALQANPSLPEVEHTQVRDTL